MDPDAVELKRLIDAERDRQGITPATPLVLDRGPVDLREIERELAEWVRKP